ncbi:peptide-methionine (R)-S-oxide reductase MsrB [Demequina aurantiaca]|uniref:peptide-methionine (R)-S-oxide reductase MsrB n=1 Tax=Demequina aurantiaca TaxID=676200 RepID=UPI003D332E50
MSPKIEKTDAQWREELSAEEYAVLREAGTERPGTGQLLDNQRDGIYSCRACGAELFRSDTKFDAHCGWPSFFEASNDAVVLSEDASLGMVRTEVRCATCESHLGHIFKDAPQTPTGDRFCINSVCLTFETEAERADQESGALPYNAGAGFDDPDPGPYGKIDHPSNG